MLAASVPAEDGYSPRVLRSGLESVVVILLLTVAIGCGESSKGAKGSHAADDSGGSSGATATGGTATGGTAAASTGGAPTGGAPTGGASTGGASSGSGGTSSGAGGALAGSGSGGTQPGGDWNAACDGLGLNGRCDGDVYRYCDYFTRSVKSLDCAAHGMRCEATPTQYYEDELNGCVGGPCSGSGAACDGALLTDCLQGELHLRDCTKLDGPTSTCTLDGDIAACTDTPCNTPNRKHCDGSIAVLCEEDSALVLIDCKRCDPSGVCIADTNDTSVGGTYCSEPTMGCTP
jgi:hypothetical protein